MKVRLKLALLLVIAAGWGMNRLSFAQDSLTPSNAGQPPSGMEGGMSNSPLDHNPNLTGQRSRNNPSPARVGNLPAESVRQAAEAVRDAEGSEAKADAQARLTASLAKYFDDDMVRRETELKQIEQRLAKLRELLDRRRTNKEEIVALQSKVALNEVNGLGFYNGERADDLRAPRASNFDSGLMPPTTDPGALRAF